MLGENELNFALPKVLKWIDEELSKYKGGAATVESLNFPRLPKYFNKEILSKTKVVKVDLIPMPPLFCFGLTARPFIDFGTMKVDSITYKDTYFVLLDRIDDESLHFHELIHVIQWNYFGPERFLIEYAKGLLAFGYINNNLELIAKKYQSLFDKNQALINVKEKVCRDLNSF